MSARPDVRRLSGEDLDLLISRSLDGDLPPRTRSSSRRSWRPTRRRRPAATSWPASSPRSPRFPRRARRSAWRRGSRATRPNARRASPASGSGSASSRPRRWSAAPPRSSRSSSSASPSCGARASGRMQYEQMEATAVARSAERNEGTVSVFFQEKKQDVAAGAPVTAPPVPAAPAAIPARKPAEAGADAGAKNAAGRRGLPGEGTRAGRWLRRAPSRVRRAARARRAREGRKDREGRGRRREPQSSTPSRSSTGLPPRSRPPILSATTRSRRKRRSIARSRPGRPSPRRRRPFRRRHPRRFPRRRSPGRSRSSARPAGC